MMPKAKNAYGFDSLEPGGKCCLEIDVPRDLPPQEQTRLINNIRSAACRYGARHGMTFRTERVAPHLLRVWRVS
jgi:hypothetical protein